MVSAPIFSKQILIINKICALQMILGTKTYA